MQQLRIRPSKPTAALAAVVGIVFVGIGVSLSIYLFPTEVPWFAKAFIGLWTFVAAGIGLYHCANVFSVHGIADEIIDIEGGSTGHSPEQRLLRLSDLRAKQVITEDEYQERRRTIVKDL